MQGSWCEGQVYNNIYIYNYTIYYYRTMLYYVKPIGGSFLSLEFYTSVFPGNTMDTTGNKILRIF